MGDATCSAVGVADADWRIAKLNKKKLLSSLVPVHTEPFALPPPPPPEAPPPVPPPAAAAVTPAEDAKPKDRDTLDAEIEAELADGDYDEASAAAIDQEFDDLF